MAYFSYHNRAKKLISQGKLLYWDIVKDYHGIKPALVLYFENHKPMPIREYRWLEYLPLLNQ